MEAEDNDDSSMKDQGKLKLWMDLAKWFLGSFAVVIVTMIVDYGFRDRAAGLQEIQQYDKYATELIILNDNPKNKRMLAQYFSHVVPSARLREGWTAYYHVVDSEYRAFLRQDTLLRDSILKLARIQGDRRLTAADSLMLQNLQRTLDNNQRLIGQPLVLPKAAVTPTVYIQVVRDDQRQTTEALRSRIAAAGFSAPAIEMVPGTRLKENEIRYFRETDKEAAGSLQKLLGAQGVTAVLNYLPALGGRTREGTLELWLK
jgi:hypothetical protein